MPDGVRRDSELLTLLLITPHARPADHTDEFPRTPAGWRVVTVSPHHRIDPVRQPRWLRRTVWPVAFSLFAIVRAWRIARRSRPDVILGHTPVTSLAVFVASIVCGVPSAMKLFTAPDTGIGWAASARIPHDLWIVVDDGTAGDVALRAHGVPSERIRLIPHGVDLPPAPHRGDADAFRRAHNIPAGAHVLLWRSRLEKSARAAHALRALANARARSPAPVVLVLIGTGPERERLRALAARLGVADTVRWVDAPAHPSLADAMASASVCLATNERSNKSREVCEAMLCGVPVVAYDTGGTGDLIRDGEAGRLIADGNEASLAEAIVELLEDTSLRMALGTTARMIAHVRFIGRERQMEMEFELLDRIVATNRR